MVNNDELKSLVLSWLRIMLQTSRAAYPGWLYLTSSSGFHWTFLDCKKKKKWCSVSFCFTTSPDNSAHWTF